MASATWDQAAAQLKLGVKPYTDNVASSSAAVTNYGAALASPNGDFIPFAMKDYIASMRAQHSALIAPGFQRQIWDGWAREVARTIGLPETNPSGQSLWVRIHRYMTDNSLSFNDRAWTRGSAAAGGSNVGTGTLKRLTVDWEGFNLQYGHVETKTFECVRDQNYDRVKGAELFEVRGEDRSKDNLDYQGSGIRAALDVMHEGTEDGGSRLVNSAWATTFNGSGADKIQGWSIGGTASNVTHETTTVYRVAPGETAGYALNIAASSGEIIQPLTENQISVEGERIPWMLQVAFKKTGSGDTGTLTLKVGNKSQAFDLSTFVNTTWNIASLDLDKDLYYRNWREDAPDVEIEWASTSSVLYLAAPIFAPMTYLDGTYWWLTGGGTAFLQRDVFTAADSGAAATDGEMMYSACRAGVPVSLPTNNAGSETITDP